MKYVLIVSYLLTLNYFSIAKETIKFSSKDGLVIAADLYMNHPKSSPFIVLFHQAGWSRGEYLEIAPKLIALGYNCMAVDLRSGGAINDVQNLTRQNALKAMKQTQYLDAYPDMVATVEYSLKNFASGKLIIWGSSYSSALAIKLAAEMPDKIDAVLAFSPGEYFMSQGKPRDFITSSAGDITKPVFITSARNEKSNWWGIYVAISSDHKKFFLPETTGNHGSRVLWEKYPDSKDYWKAVTAFLETI